MMSSALSSQLLLPDGHVGDGFRFWMWRDEDQGRNECSCMMLCAVAI